MQHISERLAVWVAALVGAATFVGGVSALVLTSGPTPADAVTAVSSQPYGGCAEAWQAPRSPGAERCRELGHTVSKRFVLGPRGVVLHSSLPHCRFEDGSGGRRPCTWNVGRRVDGNGVGVAYKVRRDMSARYVWPRTPAVDGWRWVSERDAIKLTYLVTRPAERRRIQGWQRCVIREGATTRVRCADGDRLRL